ncbi:MAG: hypothetical protein JNM56_39055 [Planctomycetia bacterium]|nr:hypothetical protein [Planctomycetia bacterium]
MSMILAALVLAGVATPTWAEPAAIASADNYFLRPKDVILFLGNSITAGAQAEFNFLKEDWKKQYPALAEGDTAVKFINGGSGGEQAAGGAKRLKKLLSGTDKPTVCVVCYGTCELTFKNEKSFTPAMKEIVKLLKEEGVLVIIVATPPPCELHPKWQYWIDGTPDLVKQARKLAEDESVLFVDAYADLDAFFKKTKKDFTSDGIHLNKDGYRVMADSLQKAWNAGKPLVEQPRNK